PAAGVPLEPMTAWERLSGEYGTLGLSPYSHPLGLLRAHLHEGIVPAAQLAHLPDGVEVQVAGLVVCRQRPGTAGGIVFMVLEDETGLANLIVYPDLYQRQRLVAGLEPFLVVRGQLQRRDGLTNVIAQGFQPLRAVARKPTAISPPRARNFY
ncbi:MAG TPA: OB-fold nucleic acid binding domain-containing protein, partial [Dehalococcoidia bacterium]|nr:OB-fold nucleic acid binding domain-containing protein [Dehalococcoidia bacterium]